MTSAKPFSLDYVHATRPVNPPLMSRRLASKGCNARLHSAENYYTVEITEWKLIYM